VGVLNGLVCVVLGWYWLRRTPGRAEEGGAARDADAEGSGATEAVP
jgi:hypothetical protein